MAKAEAGRGRCGKRASRGDGFGADGTGNPGRITSDTAQLLKTTVTPLFSESKTLVLDLKNVSYMDSSGLGTIVGLYVSAKNAHCELKLTNLNRLLKDLFSITRLG